MARVAPSWWLRSAVLVVAVAASIATQPAVFRVDDEVSFDVELSEPAPTVTFLVTATYDVPEDSDELAIAANARIERNIGAGEFLTVSIDPDDGGDGGATDSRDLGRPVTIVSPFSEIAHCGRPCVRDFLVTMTWEGAPANDFANVELTITASAERASEDFPDDAGVAVTAELLQ